MLFFAVEAEDETDETEVERTRGVRLAEGVALVSEDETEVAPFHGETAVRRWNGHAFHVRHTLRNERS